MERSDMDANNVSAQRGTAEAVIKDAKVAE
jgi:hypothetical protein